MDSAVPVVKVADTVTYKLGLKQCSVLAPHPTLNYLILENRDASNGLGGGDSSGVDHQIEPSVFYVCRMSAMQIDMLKELLPSSSPMVRASSLAASSTTPAASSHVYDVAVRTHARTSGH
jgi:hypothetical protein